MKLNYGDTFFYFNVSTNMCHDNLNRYFIRACHRYYYNILVIYSYHHVVTCGVTYILDQAIYAKFSLRLCS